MLLSTTLLSSLKPAGTVLSISEIAAKLDASGPFAPFKAAFVI